MTSDLQTALRTAALLLCAAAACRGDDVSLVDGGKLSGKVSSLTAEGHLLLETPLSKRPLDLRTDRISRVGFASGVKGMDQHDFLVLLNNGDQFSCDLQGIDENSVKVATTFAGPLVIPRTAMRTLQFGVRPRKIIYTGPENPLGWDFKSGWKHVSGTFVAEANGVLTRSFDLPENHLFHFDLNWGTMPSLQINLDDDALDPNVRADRYVLNVSSGGFDLKREEKEGNHRFLPMANIPRDLLAQAGQNVSIEVRIDRKLAQVSLFVDGKAEGRWADPDPARKAPKGNGVLFRSNIAGEDSLTLSSVRVSEWDASADRHRSEERGDASKDSIILRDGDRGMGQIVEYRADPDGVNGTLVYKMAHLENPLETPASDISTLFFAEPSKRDTTKQPATLVLSGRGSLSLMSMTIDGGTISAKHPLLGDLNLRADAIVRLERGPEPPKKAEEDDSGDDNNDGE